MLVPRSIQNDVEIVTVKVLLPCCLSNKCSIDSQLVITMSKEVQMSIKMERVLRDEFVAAAAATHRPASQIIREFMQSYISHSHEPNEETIRAMEESERGEVFTATDVDDFCKQLGI